MVTVSKLGFADPRLAMTDEIYVQPREDFQHATAEQAKLPQGDQAALSDARNKAKQDPEFVFQDPRRIFELNDAERELVVSVQWLFFKPSHLIRPNRLALP